MRSLELSDLEIFRSVALEGGVSRAAERLHRVQSNISTRVRQLEDRLGVRLFLRKSRGLALTPAGETLLPYAERLLDLSIEAEAALTDGKPRGNFRVGTLESTAASRLPGVLSRYNGCYPDVQVELVTDTTQGLLNRLLGYEIEVAFVAGPVSHVALDTAPVFSVVLETSSYHVILACVAAGTGFAAVPRSVLDTVAVKGEFRVHPLPGPASKIDTLLVWRSDYTSAKLDSLKEILTS